jgi:hypothetical protein
MKTPILGSSYVARSVNAADNHMINMFPEIVPEGGKEPAYLSRAPGLRLLATVGDGPIRGLWTLNQYTYVVSKDKLYKIDASYTSTLIGTVSGAGPVSIADNGKQIFIACNPEGFIYNTTTNTFNRIVDPDFAGAVSVGYIDGYFVFNQPDSQKIWVTSLYDGMDIDALDFASAEGAPDNLVGLIVDHREIWLFGENSVEVWYNAGTPDFPLQRIQGAYIETGCVSAYTLAKLDNTIIWLAKDTRGRGVVYKANGYRGERISTHAVEDYIQNYPDISDALAYSYQQDGHQFYVLIFPSANATWVYDMSTGAWHQRAYWYDGSFYRHRSNCQTTFNSEVVVGDFENSNLYAFDLKTYADNNDTQKWLRSWRALPTGKNDLTRTAQHSLQLDAETGVGINNGQGSDPQVMLRWSDDGGHTWSNEHWTSMGKIGIFGRRAIWRRLGMTLKIRDRVYEVSGTDPVKIIILGAELHLSGTNA